MTRISKPDLALSPKRRALLEKLIREEDLAPNNLAIIPRRESAGPVPLSYSQRRLWFIDRLTPNNPAYNDHVAIHLTGFVNPQLLEQSIREIIRRHEALRSFIQETEVEPVQIVLPELELVKPEADLCGLEQSARVAEYKRIAAEEARKPFDPRRAPLLRVTLLRVGVAEAVLLLSVHHIASDGWSLGVFIRELSILCGAFSGGVPSQLPELQIQYPDYAGWHRQRIESGAITSELSYWVEKLAGAPLLLEFPTDRARPTMQTYNGAREYFDIRATTTGSFRALARQKGATLFMALLSLFKILLHRTVGCEDVIVGAPVSGRGRTQLEPLIGCFANLLVLRTQLSGAISFREVLDRVEETAQDAYENQEAPFEKLVETLKVDRDLSRSPIFQIAFVLQNATAAPDIATLKTSILEVDPRISKFDLTISLEERGEELQGWVEYNTDLFDDTTIKRTSKHFSRLFEGVVADPEARILDLPILTECEQQTLIREWNNGSAGGETAGLLHQRFEAWADRSTDAAAVVCEGRVLSYGELNARANRLARHLQTLGARPERIVGILVERTEELVVGILSILKSGAAYLPMDPSYPQGRIALMLEASNAIAVITHKGLAEKVGDGGCRVVDIVSDWERIRRHESSNIVSGGAIDNLAYVIFTSGSSGRPKGALVTHSNAARLFEVARPRFGFNEQDVWTLFHSCAFDFSIWEIWGALNHGGRLIIVTYGVSRSPDSFYNLLQAERVTVLNQTPSAFRQLIQVKRSSANQGELGLRFVVFGGEALDIRSLIRWFEEHGDETPRLINMYGITETTVHVTHRALTSADINQQVGSVIGAAIPDLRIYVLDEDLKPVPIGVSGVLYVGGAGLARGYLNSESTAERFVPDQFAGLSGSRIYNSGDAVRYLGNGDLQYQGRVDHQVKVRGYRIELGEIEAAALSHPGVGEITVIVREDRPGDKQIVAYMAPRRGCEIDVSRLRSHLKEILPDYMTPSSFVLLEQLPLTANGKLDKRRLPAPNADRSVSGSEFVAPATSEERTLADIWSEVLGIEQVGMQDNLFALGGDSIRCIQIASRAREKGLALSLQQLFQHQTIGELARAVSGVEAHATPRSKPFDLVKQEDRSGIPAGVEDAYPLARLQAGMLFHSQSRPDSSLYHNITSFHLRAPFKLEALEKALAEVIQAHPALRTSFDFARFTEPLQLVRKEVRTPLRVSDLRELNREEQEQAISSMIEREKRGRFDHTLAPLIRFQVDRRSEETFQFTVTEEHAILDGWSVASMITEIFQRYLHRLGVIRSPLAARPGLTFRDFVALERSALEDSGARQFWAEQLKKVTPFKPPPCDSSYQAEIGDEQLTRSIKLPQDINDGLRRFAASIDVPLKAVLLASHFKVLGMLHGRQNVSTGVVFNGRLEEEDGDRVLGLHLNTLPLTVELRAGSWAELTRRALQAEMAALPYRRYPLTSLHGVSGAQDFYETAFNFIHFHAYRDLLKVREIELLEETSFQETNFTFVAEGVVDVSGSELSLRIGYDARRLSSLQIDRITGYYFDVFRAMAFRSMERHELHSSLSQQERSQILFEWNETWSDYPREQTIHELFDQQAEALSEQAAVVFEDEHLSYVELNRRANQVAHYLRGLGVAPEVRVGLLMGRCVEMVVGMLGVLKAGGAYVPLDPTYPAERLAFMIKDSEAQVLLTRQRLLQELAEYKGHAVCMDEEWSAIAKQSEENPNDGALSESLAYIIYTSGSTGRPNGVSVSHRAISRLVFKTNYIQLRPSDRVAQASNVSFDAATFEIWGALLHGARVVGISKDTILSPADLATRLKQKEVSVLFLTTALFNQIAREAGTAFSTLRYVLFGGEAVEPGWGREVLQRGAPEHLLHVYGPTESTTFATWREVRHVTGDARTIPIGKPLSNTQCYVLDWNLQPVLVGVPGELLIGGDGLARGYFKRPDLTAERFIPHPFSHEPGSCLYRTGDLSRYLPDGDIEFLGRYDDQVKLRGYRIELAEIETALRQHPRVREAVALARQDAPGEKRLVAYFISDHEPAPTTSEVRAFLKKRLPEYMMPSSYLPLDELPLTPNGKVDRRRLPAPGREAVGELKGPREPVEEIIAGIWCDVLGLEFVSSDQNFFELGGHSLLATLLISRVRDALGVEAPLRALFENPTVAGLADAVERERGKGWRVEAPPIRPVRRAVDLPLAYAQQRLWFVQQLEPNSVAYNLSIAIQLQGALNVAALRQGLGEIMRRHEALRTRFEARGGRPVQVIDEPYDFELRNCELRYLEEDDRQLQAHNIIRQEGQRPFDLELGPVWRAALVKLAGQDHLLILTLHHIASDEWSLGVMVREFTALYEGFGAGDPSPLSELPIQYVDFAVWQRQCLTDAVLEAQLAYWQGQLAGSLEPLKLPADRPRRRARTLAGASQSFVLPAVLTDALRRLSRRQNATLFMTLLAGFQALLHRYTGQDDIVVGAPFANRGRTETQDLIGFFVNTLVLRAQLYGNPTFEEVLAQVREVTLNAHAHQDLPFEKLVEALHPERQTNYTPLFQVWFVLNEAPQQEKAVLSGLTLRPVDAKTTISMFDLILSMRDSGSNIEGAITYDTDLFDDELIDEMIESFSFLLTEVTTRPGRRILDIPLNQLGERAGVASSHDHGSVIEMEEGFLF